MSINVREIIKKYNETKKYIVSLGYELGQYDFKKGKNVILKNINSVDGCRKIVGYIKSGDFDSLEIIN